MIIDNSYYNILAEIPLDIVFRMIFVVSFILLVLFGLLFKINGTKSFLKIMFHKYNIIVLLLSMFWASLIWVITGSYLAKFYSTITIFSTFAFSTLILCLTAYKLPKKDYFIKNMILDNFKFNSILWVILGLWPFIFHFNIYSIIFEFIKSLILPLILELLFLPIMYVIALLNEYVLANNLLPIVSSNYGMKDIFKKYNVCLKGIHRFNKQMKYKSSNKKEIKLIDSCESEFNLKNNNIYLGNEIIGKYECNVKIPKITGKMNGANSIEKDIYYIIGDSELENFTDDMSFVYFIYKNTNVKLFLKINCIPLHIWSPLIEDIYEFNLLDN